MNDCCFPDNRLREWNEILLGARCERHSCRKEALNQARVQAIAYLEARGVSADGGAATNAVKEAVERGLVGRDLLSPALGALRVRNALMYHSRDHVGQEEVLESVMALRKICDVQPKKEQTGREPPDRGQELAALLVALLVSNADVLLSRARDTLTSVAEQVGKKIEQYNAQLDRHHVERVQEIEEAARVRRLKARKRDWPFIAVIAFSIALMIVGVVIATLSH